MGTTLTAMLFSGSKIGMVHIGDSRAYMLRDGEFAQITKDDTYVQMLVDEGRISAGGGEQPPAAVAAHPRARRPRHRPGVLGPPGAPGDRYLICSDGLSGVVSAETIGETHARRTPTRSSASSGWCSSRCAAAARTTSPWSSPTPPTQDIVEPAPIVGGAAARDRGNATVADASTPAARAAALCRRRAACRQPAGRGLRAGDDAGAASRSGTRSRTACCCSLLLGVLGGGLWLGWQYTQ